ncbi:RluA family pseudouridine synthase [Paenibacillus sp. IITD108]|uniref:RluA family pseudouridine synthase n=1 Tax=Paenibacillus sp. IITD108 TaxID=3116649 RepID=UPI002F402424
MDWHIAINRSGEWMELDWELIARWEIGRASDADRITKQLPEPGSHVHLVKQWLIEAEFFPAKWINRLFSVGGMKWRGHFLQLHAFPKVDLKKEPLFVKAMRVQEKLQIEVLYEDDYCLVLLKPVGMPVHEANERQTAVLDIAAAQYAMSGCEEPFPVRHIHRLDADTSGAVLYSKNDLAQYRLDEAMRSNQVERYYIAAVHGVLKKNSGVIKLPIGKDRHISGKRRVAQGGEMAVTHYQCLARGSDCSLAALQLETGRTHQIRVHMSDMGHPLIGDSLYGGVGNLGHQALHAERLIFPHPITGRRINVEAPWPDWLKKFAEQMKD